MTSWGVNSLDLFTIGLDASIQHKAWNGSTWFPSQFNWESLGGTFIYEPAAVSWGPERIDIFAIGTDSALYWKWGQSWDGTQWQWGPDNGTWENLGGDWRERPSVISTTPNRLDLFLVGSDHSLHQMFFDGTNWNSGSIDVVGLGTIYPPSLTTWAPGGIQIWDTGDDFHLYQKWWTNGTWGPNNAGYANLGSTRIVGRPKTVQWGPNQINIDIFAVGEDSALYHNAWRGSSWGGWENLGSEFRSPPEVVLWGPDRFDVFLIGKDSAVYHKWYDVNSGWGPSGSTTTEPLEGTAVHDLTAVNWGPQHIDLFAVGLGGVTYQKTLNGNIWSDWINLGGISISSVARSS